MKNSLEVYVIDEGNGPKCFVGRDKSYCVGAINRVTFRPKNDKSFTFDNTEEALTVLKALMEFSNPVTSSCGIEGILDEIVDIAFQLGRKFPLPQK